MVLKNDLKPLFNAYSVIVLMIASFSFSLSAHADVDAIKSVKFQNGNRVISENSQLFFVFSNGERISLRGNHSSLLPAKQTQTQARAVIVEDRTTPTTTHRFLVQEDGHVNSLPVRMDGATEWSHSSLIDNGILYDVVSVNYHAPKKSVVVLIRTSDGHRLRMQTNKYIDQSARAFAFDPKRLGWDLERFEANDGYSNTETNFDRNLFLGYENGRFKRIIQSTSATIASGFAGITNKIQFGLEALMDEFQSNNELEDKLNSRVFGQSHLVKSLVRNSHVINDENSTRPRVVMITGTSGAGKTFVAQQLAEEVLNDKDFFLEIDGTKYAGGDMREGAVIAHKLLGAEKAYQGSQTGELTEFLRRTKGRGVIVINEAEKMNPYIFTRLMEYFDKGLITAGDGEEIAGKQVLVVLTSNRGARQLIPEAAKNWTEAELERYVSGITSDEVKRVFTTKQKTGDYTLPEEIINRIDDFLLSSPLTKSVLNKIFRSAIIRENKDLETKYKGLNFQFSDAALDYLATVNTDLHSHGRMMNRRAEGIFKDIKESVAKALSSKRWNLSQVSAIDVAVHEDSKHRWNFVVNNDLYVPVPQPPNPNPLADPVIRKIVTELDTNLKRRVIGQDAMIDNIHELIINHLAQGVRYYPTVFMTVGTTGTGKTETGLAIAESVYGSTQRAGIMDLGDVSSAYQFALKFEQGLDGAESEFERYLRSNPEGGVLILDEVSNMGGQNRAMKNELFKKFYAIFDRGTWESPVTGKTYDLSKHIIQLTGNDGEHFFAGSSADEDRLEIWKSKNREEIIHEMLIESGIPEALLGRLASVILTKPLLRAELRPIAEKILKEKIKPLEEQYRGLRITYAPDVLNSLADSFFTHGRGVRSIRTVVDKRFGSAIQMALFQSGLDLNQMSGVSLELKIEDNKTQLPYRKSSDPERKVEIVVNLTKTANGEPIFSRKVNLTEYAQEQVLLKQSEAWTTAVHEASHAVANVPEITAEKVAYITIRGGTFGTGSNKIKYLGYARSKQIDGYSSRTHAMVVGQIARIAAGSVGEMLAGQPMTGGWADDLSKIRGLARAALISYGFDPRFHGIQIDAQGNPILSEKKRRQFEAALGRLIQEGMDLAKTTLTTNWDYVLKVAAELMTKGEIDGKRFEDIGQSLKTKSSKKSRMCLGYYGG